MINKLCKDPDVLKEAKIGTRETIILLREKLMKLWNAKYWVIDSLYEFDYLPAWVVNEERSKWAEKYKKRMV